MTNNDFIVDKTDTARQLISDIYKFRTEKNIKEDDLKGHVEFFENMFDNIIEKDNCVTNEKLIEIMELMCSNCFLKVISCGDKSYRHLILDAFLLAVCRSLYSDLDFVKMFNSADKYYS